MEMQTVERPVIRSKEGSLDHAAAALQMRGINYALRVYFGTDDWLTERDRRIPSMRRIRSGESLELVRRTFQQEKTR